MQTLAKGDSKCDLEVADLLVQVPTQQLANVTESRAARLYVSRRTSASIRWSVQPLSVRSPPLRVAVSADGSWRDRLTP